MRRLVWVAAWVVVALWSLLAWAGYGLVGLAGGLASGGAGVIPASPEGLAVVTSLLGWLTSLGLAAVMVLWLVVSAGILALAWVAASLVPRGRPEPDLYRRGEPYDGRVIDGSATRLDERGPAPDPARRDPAAYARDLVKRLDHKR